MGAVTGSWSKVLLLCSVVVAAAYTCSPARVVVLRQGRSSARRCDAASILYDESTSVQKSIDEKGTCATPKSRHYGFSLLTVPFFFQRNLTVRTYTVVPLTQRSGILEWVQVRCKYTIMFIYNEESHLSDACECTQSTTPIGDWLVGSASKVLIAARMAGLPWRVTE